MRRYALLSTAPWAAPRDGSLVPVWLGLAGVPRPRVCLVPTATGDNPDRIATAVEVLGAHDVDTRVLSVFRRRPGARFGAELDGADMVYVLGGNTTSMLALWRLHGVDELLADASDAGVLLSGASAGAICWFDTYVTDSFGDLVVRDDGLGWLPGGACTHMDSEPARWPTVHAALADGRLPDTLCLDDGSLVTAGTDQHRNLGTAPAVIAHPDGRTTTL